MWKKRVGRSARNDIAEEILFLAQVSFLMQMIIIIFSNLTKLGSVGPIIISTNRLGVALRHYCSFVRLFYSYIFFLLFFHFYQMEYGLRIISPPDGVRGTGLRGRRVKQGSRNTQVTRKIQRSTLFFFYQQPFYQQPGLRALNIKQLLRFACIT